MRVWRRGQGQSGELRVLTTRTNRLLEPHGIRISRPAACMLALEVLPPVPEL